MTPAPISCILVAIFVAKGGKKMSVEQIEVIDADLIRDLVQQNRVTMEAMTKMNLAGKAAARAETPSFMGSGDSGDEAPSDGGAQVESSKGRVRASRATP